MNIQPRNRRLRTIVLEAAVLGAAATVAAHPAAAAGVITAVTTVSCSVTGANWCISGNNTSSGIGVIGTSKTGTGLRGTSTSQYGLKATSVTGTAILAQTTSGPVAISATASSGYGVTGTGYVGLFGSSPSDLGVYGTTLSGNGYGVSGEVSGGGIGVNAYSGSGNALFANSNSGAGKATLLAVNSAGNSSEFRGGLIGVISRTPSYGFSFIGTNQDGSADEFYVDGSGDISYHGGLFHFSAVGHGATVKSFSPNSTQPTVEDTGTAQLVGGVATVRLDPTFAASVEAASGYRVFVTPNGDTNGLFVATKSANGFIVRESRGGHSTVSFDFRIVATALGQSGQHMAFVNEAASGFAPHAAAVALPALSVPATLKAPAEPVSP